MSTSEPAKEGAPSSAETPSVASSSVSTSVKPAATTQVSTNSTLTAPAVAQTKVVPTRRPPSGPVVTSRVPAASLAPGTAASTNSKKKKNPNVSMAAAPNQGGSQSENTGRWTAEEHRLFLQGLEQHGKGWKKIASLIKSRTVVQIRTHAQKYFQKLAKARQNGEEGDVTMEGREASVGSVGVPNVAAQSTKRRRQITGTKRKAIQSVVSSAIRQGKKMATAQAAAGVKNPVPPLPAVAPALAHFLVPQPAAGPSLNQGSLSAPSLEESLFRFLTPAPVVMEDSVARHAGANPITVPSSNSGASPSISGETSPTGVQELSLYPSWTDAKDPPSWYAKGGDVDALLDVADTLDWLADTGDPDETYRPPADDEMPDVTVSAIKLRDGQSELGTSTSVSTLPHVDSNVESVVPPLPALFEGTSSASDAIAGTVVDDLKTIEKLTAEDDTEMNEHLEVFDSPMEEHDFVTTILENKSSDNLVGWTEEKEDS